MASYVLKDVAIDDDVLAAFPPLVRTLLVGRGITTREEAEQFAAPDWERDTHDPFLMKDMQRVVERVMQAMEAGETIAIWSDYDMDGIPGAVLLHDTFQAIGYEQVLHHTPHRNKDGFGLNTAGLDELKAQNASLVISIDCGITDVEQVTYANTRGLEVVITDHHIPGEVLPPAYAILNPKQTDCEYPEPMLCGAGVIFKFCQALLTHLREAPSPREGEGRDGGGSSLQPAPPESAQQSGGRADYNLPPVGWEKWLLDMAGMATIADMVPLRGENRALAYFGLMVLRKSRRLGLQALLRKARANQRYLSEDDVGFTIAPRVNAASRMGHAKDAFALLTATDAGEAGVYADALDKINTDRKRVVASMKREIHGRIKKLGEPKSVIVMGNPEWKPSLLGLVAGGLAEEYERPVFLWGREEGITIKGSCRGYGGVSVYAIMREAKEVFLEYGGHTAAGGFSVGEAEVHALEAALVEAHAAVASNATGAVHEADAALSLDDVTWDTYNHIVRLAPFGEGNPKPVFMFAQVNVANVRTFGKGDEHLELTLNKPGGGSVKAIAFFTKPEQYPLLASGEPITLIAHLEASYFRGRELRLRLVDVG